MTNDDTQTSLRPPALFAAAERRKVNFWAGRKAKKGIKASSSAVEFIWGNLERRNAWRLEERGEGLLGDGTERQRPE